MNRWTAADIPDQTGRTAVVTGANSGLGLETTVGLVAKGAHVVMAGRNPDRLAAAERTVLDRVPGASLATAEIDLGSLESICDGAAGLLDRHPRIDLLFDNAGVMAPPRSETVDGFESQFGINHLGHFALTGRLLPALLATDGSRVVVVTSTARKYGDIYFDDLNWQRRYRRWGAYGQSRLANLLFAVELDRRLRKAGADMIAVAAHPGYAATNLQSGETWIRSQVYRLGNLLLAQPAAAGAWPQLYAGTAPGVGGGALYGPDKLGGMRGFPRREPIEAKAADPEVAFALWERSVGETGVGFEELIS